MNKVKLEVLGLSYSQTQVGAYALILSVENSEERIPIIIGGFEAQAIAIQLEALKPPRPLTHDLFYNFAKHLGVNISEVFIHSLEEGIFYSKIIFEKDTSTFELDSRTSDAVALALKFNAPIYTTTQIVQKAGVIISITEEEKESINPERSKKQVNYSKTVSYENMTIEELENLLEEAISKEEYEIASLIKQELERRNKKI